MEIIALPGLDYLPFAVDCWLLWSRALWHSQRWQRIGRGSSLFRSCFLRLRGQRCSPIFHAAPSRLHPPNLLNLPHCSILRWRERVMSQLLFFWALMSTAMTKGFSKLSGSTWSIEWSPLCHSLYRAHQRLVAVSFFVFCDAGTMYSTFWVMYVYCSLLKPTLCSLAT